MRRTPLLILSLLFIALCITCFFYSDHSNHLHLALIVELVFFIQFAMVKKLRMAVKTPESISSSQPLEQHDHKHELEMGELVEAPEPEVMEVNS